MSHSYYLFVSGVKFSHIEDFYWFDCSSIGKNLVLAPGAIWRSRDVDKALLWEGTSKVMWTKYNKIHKYYLKPLIEGCPTCLEDLFICVEGKYLSTLWNV